MPVEGAIPHLAGIEMYGDSIPAETVGGDLFEYINFQQQYYIEAREVRSLEMLRAAENLAGLYDTAGVLLVDAQGHGIISAKIASTVHDTFHSFMLSDLDRYEMTTPELFENVNIRLAHSVTARNALGRTEGAHAREITAMLYGEVHWSGHFLS